MDDKIILVTRQTRLEALVGRFNTRAQARFYIEHSGGNFGLYEREHEVYQAAVSELRRRLAPLGRLQVIERDFLPNFIFTPQDIVVTTGVDGLVVNTAKYLDGQPLVAANPDPAHIDGVLLPFTVLTAPEAVRRVQRGQAQFKPVSMAEARLNDGQALLAFNDLFIGVEGHTSARYHIRCGEQAEEHSSSGVIVSTGAGATGWLSSLFNMANGLWRGFGAQPETLPYPELPWDAGRLIFVVREPFISKTSAAGLVCGVIGPGQPLELESHIPSGGVIFSDGIPGDYLAFNAGSQATVQVAERRTQLVVG